MKTMEPPAAAAVNAKENSAQSAASNKFADNIPASPNVMGDQQAGLWYST